MQGTTKLYTPEEWLAAAPEPAREALGPLLKTPAGCRCVRLPGDGDDACGVVSLPQGQERRYALYFAFWLRDGGQELDIITENSEVAEQLGLHGELAPAALLPALLPPLLEKLSAAQQALGGELDAVEERLMVRLPRDFYGPLLGYQRRANRLHNACQQLADLCEQMEDAVPARRGDWRRLADRALRLHDMAELLREQLVQLREFYQAQVSAAQNETVTLLTVLTAVFAPLTLLTGWFGMNFAGMPELSARWGYPCVIGAAVLIVAAELWWLHRKKML